MFNYRIENDIVESRKPQAASTLSGVNALDGPSTIMRSLTIQCTPRYVGGSNLFDSASSLSMTPMSRPFDEEQLLRETQLEEHISSDDRVLARIDMNVSEILRQLQKLNR